MKLGLETPKNEYESHAAYYRPLSVRLFAPLLGILSMIAIWGFLSLFVPSYLLPNPLVVARTFVDLFKEGNLLQDVTYTMITAIGGIMIAAISAIFLAGLFVLSKRVESVTYPLVVALRSVPAVAAAPILVIWTGTGLMMKLFVAAFVSFFPILVYLLHGLRAPREEYLDQFSLWAASKTQVLWHLRIPWAIPSFFASLRVAVTYALIGSFVAEMMGSQVGLGRMVMSAYYHFDTPTVLVGIICFAFLGVCLFGIAVGAEKFVLKRIPLT